MLTATIHPFESAGLGKAPFVFVGLSECVIRTGDHCQPAGTCDYCGTGIKYRCYIRSNDGREFIVGTDCVRKIGRDDNRLLNDVERAVALANQRKRDAERQAKRDAEQARLESELQRQRIANGGRTDDEMRQDQQKAERAALTEKNGWIINVIRGGGDWCDSIASELETREIKSLPDRAVSILADIWAKQNGGRRGSKAYDAAMDEFYAKID